MAMDRLVRLGDKGYATGVNIARAVLLAKVKEHFQSVISGN